MAFDKTPRADETVEKAVVEGTHHHTRNVYHGFKPCFRGDARDGAAGEGASAPCSGPSAQMRTSAHLGRIQQFHSPGSNTLQSLVLYPDRAEARTWRLHWV